MRVGQGNRVHITRAYCVEAQQVVDIYQARALYFGLSEPRRRFEFLCSDDACRSARATRVTGVNYDKLLVEESDQIVQKPHFRANPDSPHIAECDWIIREQALLAFRSREMPEEKRRPRRDLRHLKANDVVDVFVPTSVCAGHYGAESMTVRALSSDVQGGSVATGHRRTPSWSNVTRTDFLGAVVTVYELLHPDERREALLRFARGRQLPYSKAFCKVERYFRVSGPRIFHGGVQIRLHGPNFVVRFFDRLEVAGGAPQGHESRYI